MKTINCGIIKTPRQKSLHQPSFHRDLSWPWHRLRWRETKCKIRERGKFGLNPIAKICSKKRIKSFHNKNHTFSNLPQKHILSSSDYMVQKIHLLVSWLHLSEFFVIIWCYKMGILLVQRYRTPEILK